MALTVSEVEHGVVGDMKYSILDVTFDSSYPTGGEDLLPAEARMTTVLFGSGHSDTPGVTANYDIANSKLLLAVAGSQPSNASNQSTTSVRVFLLGR